ncbi:MAG: DUF1949 domain-containing protein, partial [Treponema sp.]|nr:DUF1949 domain-containing protein [Treponema sp.]
LYKSVKRAFEDFAIDGLCEEYTDKVKASGSVPQDQYASLAARLKDLSKGLLVLS